MLAKIKSYGDMLEMRSPKAAGTSPRRKGDAPRAVLTPSGDTESPTLAAEDAASTPDPHERRRNLSHQLEQLKSAEDHAAERALELLGPDNDLDARINPDVQPRWRNSRV